MTNKVYVTNRGGFPLNLGNVRGASVKVIDGATYSVTDVIDLNPCDAAAVAVNPVTNKIYVANGGSSNVTVIDGATKSTTTVTDPNAISPAAVAVNSVTNKIYVANATSNNVTVIDGVTNATTTVTDHNASSPIAVAVNPMTNKIYVANQVSNSVTVIDGSIPAPPSEVTVSPTSLTFTGQNVGTTSSGQIVTLTNHGGAALSLTSVAATGDFSAHKLCPQSIKAQGSCKITVVFKPTQTLVRTGMLTITDSDPASPQIVALTGTGTAPLVSLSTASLSFAGQLVGTSSAAQKVMLTNTGDGPLTISSITASGDFISPPGQCAGTIAGSSSPYGQPLGYCEIAVTFKPQGAGSRTGSLSIVDDAADSPQSVTLSGTGEDFAVSAAKTSATVTAGQTASYTLSLASQGGFSRAVSLTCTGAPTAASCSLTPSSVTVGASGATPVTVRVTTTARSMAVPTGDLHSPGLGSPRFLLLLAWLIALSALAFTRVGSRALRRTRFWAPLGALLLLVMLWVGCGSGAGTSGPSPTMGTPTGTYMLTVAATSSGLTNNVSLILVVN